MGIESHLEHLQQVYQCKKVQHPTHHQRHRKVHKLLGEQLVGAGVPWEGTHFRGLHRAVCRFHIVLLVGGVETPLLA
jgi:hypothetical protein